MSRRRLAAAAAVALIAAGCGGGVSTTEAERAAEAKVREKFALPPDTELESEIFVGRPRDGETTLCGRVRGQGIPPQRFVAATDPARWLVFEPAGTTFPTAHPERMFADWEALCLGAEGDEGDEPLAPTERGEEL